MSKIEDFYTAPGDRLEPNSDEIDQLGIYKSGFQFKKEALAFFESCVGREIYERAMSSEAGRQRHYVVARAFLSQTDWEKFVWIEKNGSLADFPK